MAGSHHVHHELQDGGAVRTAIDQVTDKDEAAPARVTPGAVIAKMVEQLLQRLDFAVNVTDDI
jgi:hypothetical protein